MRKLTAFFCAALLLLTAACGGSQAELPDASADTAAIGGAMPIPPAQAQAAEAAEGAYYADTLFDTSYVHSIDIRVDGDAWDAFILNCSAEEYIEVDMTIDGEPYESAAIRGKGNSSMQRSRSTGKYSFKVEFDHFRDGLFRGLDKLALNNLTSDDSCMRDYIVYQMMGRFGVPSPLCSYVFMTVNGEDWGFYLAVEGPEDSFLERNYGPEHGNLFKPDNTGGGGGFPGGGGGGGWGDDVKLKYIDDDPASYPSLFGSAKTDVSRRDQYRLIRSLKNISELTELESSLNIQEMLRYLVVQTFVGNGDSYTGSSVHNYYLYEEEGRLSMLPWDYNEAFGDFGSSGMASVVNAPIDTPLLGADFSERPMVAWVFSDEGYVERYHALYREFLAQMWDSGWITGTLEATRDLIAPYVQRDPRSFTTYDAFLSSVDEHILFFRLRAESVQGQLDGVIPSTTEGQRADPSALVDTSELPSRGMGSGGMGERPSRSASREAGGEEDNTSGGASDESEDNGSGEAPG